MAVTRGATTAPEDAAAFRKVVAEAADVVILHTAEQGLVADLLEADAADWRPRGGDARCVVWRREP